MAAQLGVASIVLLISWLHVHPFLAPIGGSAVLGLLGVEGTIASFPKGRPDRRSSADSSRRSSTLASATSSASTAPAPRAGSLFFSHLNDAGFWLVKAYLGLTVGQTIKSWTVMER